MYHSLYIDLFTCMQNIDSVELFYLLELRLYNVGDNITYTVIQVNIDRCLLLRYMIYIIHLLLYTVIYM